MYVIIDESLDPIYGCVQGGHAVAQYLIENPDSEWKNNYLVYLKGDVKKIMLTLESLGIYYTEFHEPDLNDKVTAIAVLNHKNLFKRLELIGR